MPSIHFSGIQCGCTARASAENAHGRDIRWMEFCLGDAPEWRLYCLHVAGNFKSRKFWQADWHPPVETTLRCVSHPRWEVRVANTLGRRNWIASGKYAWKTQLNSGWHFDRAKQLCIYCVVRGTLYLLIVLTAMQILEAYDIRQKTRDSPCRPARLVIIIVSRMFSVKIFDKTESRNRG